MYKIEEGIQINHSIDKESGSHLADKVDDDKKRVSADNLSQYRWYGSNKVALKARSMMIELAGIGFCTRAKEIGARQKSVSKSVRQWNSEGSPNSFYAQIIEARMAGGSMVP